MEILEKFFALEGWLQALPIFFHRSEVALFFEAFNPLLRALILDPVSLLHAEVFGFRDEGFTWKETDVIDFLHVKSVLV